MRKGLEARNGVGGEDHARYGHPCPPQPDRSKFMVSDRVALGLCITTLSRLLDGIETDALCKL
jgi:hypothetical protein